MRKKVFLKKCILAALPFLLVMLYTFLCPLAYMDAEYPAWYDSRRQIYSTNDYDMLIMGDSRAMADLIPGILSESSYNLAVGGATAIENYYFLRTYLNNHPAPKRVLVVYAPFHYSYIDNFRQRTLYFNALSASDVGEILGNAEDLSAESVSWKGVYMDALSYRLRLPHQYLPALMNSHFIGRYNENAALWQELTDARGHGLFGTADGCSDLNYEVNYEGMVETGDSALIALYLRKFMELCEEKGIQVILEQPPMNESSYVNLHESYVKSYMLYMKSIADLYPKASVECTIPMYSDELFGDSSHLNEKGAEKFSMEIKNKYRLR